MSSGNKATPISRGVQRRPNPDPRRLRFLPAPDWLKSPIRPSQKGTRVIDAVVNAMKNRIEEDVFASLFLASTAPKSLK